MDCIIIEDGPRALNHLENQLAVTGYDVNVTARLDSVESAVLWLKQHTADLIFMDVQLGDGLGFEIFDHVDVSTPVIFTTSYDQYLMRSFEVNNIAYLLKPVKSEDLSNALAKYKKLYAQQEELPEKIVATNLEYQKRFMVQKGSSMRVIPVEEVAYLYIHGKGTIVLVAKDGQQYLLENTLDRLAQRLDPDQFFRINRQYIIHLNAISNMEPFDTIRLRIDTAPASKEPVVVSSKRMKAFKEWLNR